MLACRGEKVSWIGARVHHVDLSVSDVAAAEPLYDLVGPHRLREGRSYPQAASVDLADGTSIGTATTRPIRSRRMTDYSCWLRHLVRDGCEPRPCRCAAVEEKLVAFAATILDPAAALSTLRRRRLLCGLLADPDGLSSIMIDAGGLSARSSPRHALRKLAVTPTCSEGLRNHREPRRCLRWNSFRRRLLRRRRPCPRFMATSISASSRSGLRTSR